MHFYFRARVCSIECRYCEKNCGNFFYGLAIGFTLMTAAYSIGNISGCAINPAVAIGLTVMGIFKFLNQEQ